VVPVGDTREHRVDVQVVLATNRDLGKAIAEGALKEDLADRFQTHTIRVQPLRERPWDVPDLVRHFVSHHERRPRKKTLGVDQEALRALCSYPWPGNVREVDRVCSLLVTRAKPGARIDRDLVAASYPAAVSGESRAVTGPVVWADASLRQAVRAFERELILARLEQFGGNTRAARESLGLPKTTFHRYTTSLGIVATDRE
jgi:DNA-binding NtrC family response regulator